LVCYLQCKVERREAKMPKKATILAVVLILFVAAPASAQQGAGAGQEKSSSRTIAVTGVIEKPEITSYMYGSHAITDEASGKRYALRSEQAPLLDDYVGQRVTVFGTSVPGYEGGAIEGGPPLIEVDQVKPAAHDAKVGEDLNGDGVVDQADGEFAATVSDAAMSEAEKSSQPVLPPTGGPTLLIVIAPLLLVAGLLIHRARR
jgi:hypothetical protein